MGHGRLGLLPWALLALCAVRTDVAHGEEAQDIAPLVAGEVRSLDLRMFPKWLRVLDRHAASGGRIDGGCSGNQFGTCAADAWNQMIEGLRASGASRQVAEVNSVMNRARYVTDLANWGVPDYWETPAEFFARDGDCEDYAIAKFISLRMLGVSSQAMRILVVQDLNLKVPHAVLAVFVAGTWYLLDNQISQVIQFRNVHHYRPIFSLNESSWWLHRR